MPWNSRTQEIVTQGLKDSAEAGRFTPRSWFRIIKSNDTGAEEVFGCHGALIAWYAAVATLGTQTAKQRLAARAGLDAVAGVLIETGLTKTEVNALKLGEIVCTFDRTLGHIYDNVRIDPQAFIDASVKFVENMQFRLDVIAITEPDDSTYDNRGRMPQSSQAEQVKLVTA